MSEDRSAILRKARGVIDSEYENLCDMDLLSFFDYLNAFGLTRAESDALFKEFFGRPWKEVVDEKSTDKI